MKTKLTYLVLAVTFAVSATSFAGIYSDAIGGAGIDQGIAGFVDGQVNSIFAGWATSIADYSPFDLAEIQNYAGGAYANPQKALGAVTGNNADIVSLGDMDATELSKWRSNPAIYNGPGSLTLGFEFAIKNGDGADFAAFENGFMSGSKLFAELGYVEVSTNGTDFARFPSVYDAASTPVGGYGTIDPTGVYNLVGKHANAYGKSFGTPFDLEDLSNHSLVTEGLVDLDEINFVRIIDIPGDGSFKDSLGNPIYDAWVTWGSGGVDFEALGVINQVPEPATVAILGLGGLLLRRRKKNA